jgi:ribosomal protein S18 acetylase RimI-like enzyme
MLTLRPATLDDAFAIALLLTELNEAVGPSLGDDQAAVSEDQARERIDAMAPGEQVLLAHVDDAPAGLLSLRIVAQLSQDVPYAEVTELYVADAYRRRGVARLLMAEAEFTARKRGCTFVHVNTWHDNDVAQAFYRAAGYESLVVGFEKPVPRKTDAKRRRAEG